MGSGSQNCWPATLNLSISQFKSNLKVVLEKISHSQINNHV